MNKSLLLFIQTYTHIQARTDTHTQRHTPFATEKCDVIPGKQLVPHGEMSVMALGPFARFILRLFFLFHVSFFPSILKNIFIYF